MWKKLIQVWRSDNLMVQAWDESYEMLRIDQRMFNEAVRILRDSDDDVVDPSVRELDTKVNKYERDVRRKVMTHCTVVGTGDLPGGMVLVSIVIDIERIGDYCKNILDLASAHPKRLLVPDHEEMLSQLELGIRSIFNEAVDILHNQDVDKAREVMRTYRTQVSDVCELIVSDIIHGRTDQMSAADAATLVLYVRYLKRISAHLKNILSSVVNPFPRIGYREKPKKDG